MQHPQGTSSLPILRQLLSQSPTPQLWWKCVEVVASSDEHEMLKDYLLLHLAKNPAWKSLCVPCGDWPASHPGHTWSHVHRKALPVLSGALEIYCPAGQYWMGADENEEEAEEDEKPQRQISLTRSFYALSTPVTQGMYEGLMGTNPSHHRHPRAPVEQVSWWQALAFCNALSRASGLEEIYDLKKGRLKCWKGPGGKGYRLPFEAEWECLCRAGSRNSTYGKLADIAHCTLTLDDEPAPVQQKLPNAWGFYDTIGNVWEWCFDAWHPEPASLPRCDPFFFPKNRVTHVIRGGDWSDSEGYANAWARQEAEEEGEFANIGFRVVRTA